MKKSFFFLFLASRFLIAAPEGLSVVSGAVEQHALEPGHLQLKAEDKTIAEWQRFSLQKGEHLDFLLPNASSEILNRVIGGESSEIFGKITSNGSIYLINENGIFIGPSAVIETAGFVSSCLDVLDQSFLQSKELLFQGKSQKPCKNYGTIICPNGRVALIAQEVENGGAILADQVHIVRGQKILLQLDEQDAVFILSEEGDLESLQSDYDTYKRAIRHTGTITAKTKVHIETDSLLTVQGDITASGGEIHLLAEHVHLEENSHIDVSHVTDGGKILVGGSFQGKDPAIRNSKCTWVGKDVLLDASSKQEGKGGEVIIWSDGATAFHGKILAEGGSQKGDGGFIEVSGKTNLQFAGKTSTLAPFGKTGNLLLDPADITVSAAASSGLTLSDPACGICSGDSNTYHTAGASGNLLNSDLVTALASNNICITTCNGTGGAGTITVSADVIWAESTTLTLAAERNIVITSVINNTNVGSFDAMNFVADGSGATGAGISISGATLKTTGGNIILDGTASQVLSGSVNQYGITGNPCSIISATGNISLTGQGGVASIDTGVVGITIQNATVTTAGDITIDGTGGSVNTDSCCSRGVDFRTSTVGCNDFGVLTITGVGSTIPSGCCTDGVIFLAGSLYITNADGTVTGTSGSPAGSGSAGVQFLSGVTVTLNGTGSLTFDGTAVGTDANCSGIQFVTSPVFTSVASSSGSFIFSGASTASSSTAAHGIHIANSVTFNMQGSGGVSFTGIGSPNSSTAHGIFHESGTITTTSGTVSYDGTASGTGGNRGVRITQSNPISTTSGDISISGISTASGTNSYGVEIGAAFGPGFSSGTPTLAFSGTGGSGSSSHGVQIAGAVTAGIADVVFLTCSAGAGSTSHAVNVTSNITTSTGDITATSSIDSGSGTNSVGFVSTATISSSSSGNIAITATSAGSSTAAYGIDISASTAIYQTSTGSITLNGTPGVSTTAGIHIDSSGVVQSTSGGALNFNTSSAETIEIDTSTISSTGLITFGGPVVLLSTISGISPGAGGLTFSSTLDASTAGSEGFTVDSGSGLVTFTGAVGTTRLGALSVTTTGGVTANAITATSITQAGTGTGTYSGALNTNAIGGISITGSTISFSDTITTTNSGPLTISNSGTLTIGASADMSLDGAFTQSGGGSVSLAGDITTTNDDITFTNATTLTGAVALDTGSGAGNVSFLSTVDGGEDLTVTAGSGTITYSGAVGGSTRLGNLSNTSTSTITAAAITAASITQLGTATGSYSGALDTNAAAGISLTGGAITLGSTVTTTNLGTVTIVNSGLLTVSVGADMTLDGAFSQSGGGSVSLGGDITTTNDAITFTNATTLTAAIALDTGSGAGNVSFLSTVDGGEDLTVTAGTGTITYSGAVGGSTRLGNLSNTSTSSITAAAITAASITQLGTATGSYSGALDTNAAAGIALTGSAITLGSTVTTTNLGTVTIVNSGLLTVSAGADMTLDGAFTQAGLGAVSLGGDITTTNDAISFGQAVTLSAGVSLNSGAGSGDITFSSTLNGTQACSITAGTGSVIFNSSVGGTTALDSLTVSGAAIQVNGPHSVQSGPMTYSGPLTLLTAGDFTNSGANAVTFGDTVSGNFDLIVVSTSSTVTFSGDIDLTGATGSGSDSGDMTVHAGGTVTASGTIDLRGEALDPGSGGLGGDLFLTSSSGSVSVVDVNTSGGTGTILGGDGGSITIMPSNATTDNVATGLAILNGDLTASGGSAPSGFEGTGGTVTISTNRANFVKNATIVSSLAGNDVSISALRLIVGPYEAVTILGNLNFQLDGSLFIGDTVALETLTLSSGTSMINLYTHGNIEILDHTGALVISPSAHFVAGSTAPSISGTLIPSGPIDSQGLGLTPAEFLPLLTFGSIILNYDPADIPPAPGPNVELALFELENAGAEFYDQLRRFNFTADRVNKICPKITLCGGFSRLGVIPILEKFK